VVLRPLEGAHHGGDDLAGEGGVGGRQGFQAAAAVRDHRGGAQGLGGEAVLVSRFDAEDVPRKVKGVDLPASVAQELRGPDRAGHHLVEEGGAVALGEDGLVLGKAPGRSQGRGLGGRPGRGNAAQEGGVRSERRAGGSERGLHGVLVGVLLV
jgi:hypothetical protein